MSIKIDANGVIEGYIVQESQDNVRKTCEIHSVIAAVQRSEREHLSAREEALASRVFLA